MLFSRVRQGRVAFAVVVSSLAVCSLSGAQAFSPDTPMSSHWTSRASSFLYKPPKHERVKPSEDFRGGAPPEPPSSSSTARGASNAVVFDNTPLLQSSMIFAVINFLGFYVSMSTSSQLHLDLLGTGAFALAALPPLLKGGDILPRVKASSIAVFTWGAKLAIFLFCRVVLRGHDPRLDDLLSTMGGTATFWIVSFIWGIVCSLPHTLGTTSSALGNSKVLSVGTGLYVVGLLTETLADLQKWFFKANNPGKFCHVGLWSISQHPNFFGNLFLWAGVFVMNASSLIEPIPKGASVWKKMKCCKRLALACLSPLFMWTFFSGQAQGTLSNTMDLAIAKYGNDPQYKEYLDTVPLIIPNVFKRFEYQVKQ